eukprot:CAMPEP_0170435548 /NCGR_PEP_ID=MMETSP0117_2-20130122/43663_1 /TAXON_ID=400756 /ORGANISM="Durinskia baltica, Strain CSIRO CS-38" /LENGTH=76 /DNA_ID=CAMNT_0010695517 /DNA_START=20 /DNA_END=246 /DNA_ORIENTATION=+
MAAPEHVAQTLRMPPPPAAVVKRWRSALPVPDTDTTFDLHHFPPSARALIEQRHVRLAHRLSERGSAPASHHRRRR